MHRCHHWLVGPREVARRRIAEEEFGEEELVVADCAGGPLAGCAALVRHLAPGLLVEDPAAVRRHDLEIHILAPDLFALTTDEPSSIARTELTHIELRRLALGMVNLLIGWGCNGTRTVIFERVDAADPNEVEVLRTLVSGVPAELVRFVMCSQTSQDVDDLLADALDLWARREDLTPALAPGRGHRNDPVHHVPRDTPAQPG